MPAAPERAADAEELASDLERLGPTFVKLGQLLSTRPDLMPEPYLTALARLQDRVEPFGTANAPSRRAQACCHQPVGGSVGAGDAA